jgi:Ran GTPase-activating protein (RanGAP) involved in mRNA processing and transport
LKVLNLSINHQSVIQTLKLSNNGLTHKQITQLITTLSADNCPIQNLFIDWNPVHADPFKSGPVADGENQLWQPGEDELSPFAQLVRDAKKLQVLFLRHSGLNDSDLMQISKMLSSEAGAQQNKTLKVLDLSHNDFSGKCVQQCLKQVFESNRSLEYVGLAKNNLQSGDVQPLLKCFGRQPFPAENVPAYQLKIKERDAILEKNKKLKASKKPEEIVPLVDALESKTIKDDTGAEVTNWWLLVNPQFKHLNICLNQIDDVAQEDIEHALSITPDDFCMTLSGNQFSDDVVQSIQKCVQQVHKQRVTEQRLADPSTQVYETADIAQRRAAF